MSRRLRHLQDLLRRRQLNLDCLAAQKKLARRLHQQIAAALAEDDDPAEVAVAIVKHQLAAMETR